MWTLAVCVPETDAQDPVKESWLARWFQETFGVPMIGRSGTSPSPL